MAKLRKDDPVYYKVKMQELIQSAKDNGVKITIGRNRCGTYIYFCAGNGEVAGVTIVEKEREDE